MADLIERDVACEMPDGAVLRADVYRPPDDGPCPVLLMRTPYGKTHGQSNSGYAHPSWYAEQGFLVVVQDCRGRWASGGRWEPFFNEAQDGFDTIEWAAGLPGSDGRVAMFGYSYPGLVQLLAAALRPPSLVAICPGFTTPQAYEGWSYRQGAFCLGWMLSWALFLACDTARRNGDDEALRDLQHALIEMDQSYWTLPLSDVPALRRHRLADYFFEWLEHPAHDAYWRRCSVDLDYARIEVPALHFTGWYDAFLDGTVQSYTGLRAVGHAPQRLVVFPWPHEPWAPVWGAQGAEGFRLADDLHVAWLRAALAGGSAADEPPVRAYVLHDGWRDFDDWPPRQAVQTAYYLHSGGRANSLFGDGTLTCAAPGDEPPDVFTYDPDLPTMSAGGHSCCDPGLAPIGPACQFAAESTKGVLVYTSAPLEQDLWLVGDVTATICAASTAPDTDFSVRLCAVDDDGCSRNLQEGIVRARFRDSSEREALLVTDEVVEYTIFLGAVGIRVPAGWRLRVDVASSDFPQWDRNLNVDGSLGRTSPSAAAIATQTVFHAGTRVSRVMLPVVPAPV